MSGKFFAIKSELNGLYLDVSEGAMEEDQRVITWEWHGGDNQMWFADPENYVIRSKQDEDFVLDLDDEDTLVIRRYDNSKSQKMIPTKRSIRVVESGKAIDIAEANQDPGARVCAWNYSGDDNQRWKFEYQPLQYFVIRSQMHGKVLDIESANPEPGAAIMMWDHNGNDNQLWYEDRWGNIYSKLNGLTIEERDGQLYTAPFNATIESRSWHKEGHKIVNRYDPDKVLDIAEGCEDDGARVCSWGYQNSPNQRWDFLYL